jgi:hypothetical protein
MEQDELAEQAERFAALPAFPGALREYTVSLMRFRRGCRCFAKRL